MIFWNETNEGPAGLKLRSEVDPDLCWDLEAIFEDQKAWEESFKTVQAGIADVAAYRGRLGESAAVLKAYIQASETLTRTLLKLYAYASMRSDEDKGNSEHATLLDRIGQLAAEVSAATSFERPELTALGQKKVEAMLQEDPELNIYEHEMKKLFRAQEHILTAKEEELLAQASEVLGSPASIFSVFNNADLRFPTVRDKEGKEHDLNHASFGRFLESADRTLRQNAFETYYKVYEQFKNTLAMTLSRQMKKDNFLASVRGFQSARQAALFNNAIDEKVHEQLLAVVNQNLPLMHRYVQLKKDIMELDELHCYDLYVPNFVTEAKTYSIEDAKHILLEAMKPLGEEYQTILRKAFAERWVDFAVNQGKRTGAYSGGSYDTYPYILISWQGTLSNLFTLAHELGHSCHSYLTRKNQPFVYGHYSIFLAEIASTTNENLLTHYLLEHEKDEAVQKYLRMNWIEGFKSTIFRQSQFAEFEHRIHEQEQAGVALSADYLSKLYAKLNQTYYGEALSQDEAIALEWSRIPHFYYNYYVYQYATGFAAAISFSESLLTGAKEARARYLDYLSAGSSDDPLEVLAKAGLDMRKPEVLEKAMRRFEQELTALEALVVKAK